MSNTTINTVTIDEDTTLNFYANNGGKDYYEVVRFGKGTQAFVEVAEGAKSADILDAYATHII